MTIRGTRSGRNAVIRLLGNPALIPYDHASGDQKRNVDILRNWQIDTSNPVTKYSWMDRIQDDGSIDLHATGDSPIGNNWVVALNNFPALVGLKYEFQVFEKGKLVGDINGDSILQEAERKATSFNDPYGKPHQCPPGGASVSPLIKESSYEVPVRQRASQGDRLPSLRHLRGPRGVVHGLRGQCPRPPPSRTSSITLDYVDKMGFNTVELMPVQEFGSTRDWGIHRRLPVRRCRCLWLRDASARRPSRRA